MKTKEVIEITEAIKKLDLHGNYRINRGGCGWFAVEMAKRIPNSKIVYLGMLVHSYGNFGVKVATAPSHAVVQVGDIYFDAEGACDYELSRRAKKLGKVMRTEYVEHSLDYDIWNIDFHRDRKDEITEQIDELFNARNND